MAGAAARPLVLILYSMAKRKFTLEMLWETACCQLDSLLVRSPPVGVQQTLAAESVAEEEGVLVS
jgi:hypothetical protein